MPSIHDTPCGTLTLIDADFRNARGSARRMSSSLFLPNTHQVRAFAS